jgi:transposase
MEPRRKYSQEFKQEVVQLTKQARGAITQVARDLGINAAMLGRWCREAGRREPKAFPGIGIPYDQELARLKRELALVTRERDFLKEAAARSAVRCMLLLYLLQRNCLNNRAKTCVVNALHHTPFKLD